MARTRKPREYRFEIDAFTPETIPLSRLSQYLADLSRLMGEEGNVHLKRIDSGSTVPVIAVDWEAEPKVRERLRAAKFNEGPAEARRALREINKRLIQDNAAAVLIDPARSKLVRFPGATGANQIEFGPITQQSVFQGIPIAIGGKSDPVPVHLQEGEIVHILQAPRRIAKELGQYLFTSVVRVEGKSRWVRNKMGEWEMLSFYANGFEVLSDGDLKTDLATLRGLPGAWKDRDDPLGDLMALQTGERPH